MPSRAPKVGFSKGFARRGDGMIFVADVSSIFVIQNIDAEETTPAANLEILTLLVVLLWTNHHELLSIVV